MGPKGTCTCNMYMFGYSVAISATHLAVGAPNDKDHGDWTGSVHVFGI